MSAEFLAPLMAIPELSARSEVAALSAATAGTASGGGFAGLVTQGLQEVNQQLMTSQSDLQQLAVGNTQNLHRLMIGLEETRMSFQLMLQVRNRLLESYQEVMRMQV